MPGASTALGRWASRSWRFKVSKNKERSWAFSNFSDWGFSNSPVTASSKERIVHPCSLALSVWLAGKFRISTSTETKVPTGSLS